MDSSYRLLALAAVLGALGLVRARVSRRGRYVLHVYDHCPFCNRVEWLMAYYNIPYKRVVYGYGAGAKPEKCEGHGYGAGPTGLTGQKLLPVLEGDNVPCAPGAKGMPESMEICAFLVGEHRLVTPCESGRADLKKITSELTALKPALVEDRIVRMPVFDWADSRDAAYRRWKKKLPIELPPLEPQSELVEQLNAKLAEVPALFRGKNCLNAWGWGIDDVRYLELD